MTALDLLFVLGQVLALVSLIYFFYLVVRWQMYYTATFRSSGHYPEPQHKHEAPVTRAETAASENASPIQQEIAAA